MASVILTLLPGPDILFVLIQSATNGARRGIIFALGLCTGLIFHTSLVAFGVSVIIAQSLVIFTAIKLAGAFYLVYLGFLGYKHLKDNAFVINSESREAVSKLYFRGIMMNLLNPKVTLFFIAFLPQFVSINSGEPKFQIFMLGFIFMIQAIFIFSVVAILAGKVSEKFLINNSYSLYINIIKVILFSGLGFWMIGAEVIKIVGQL